MATILRGKKAGQTVKISQWCNDWVTGQLPNGSVKAFTISALKFTPEEFRAILFHENNGTLLEEFEPNYDTYTFKRKRRR
ncbi:MAG TPA: hypothetical protein VLB82_11855 [Thermodesulfobacteriota bacterium]|nr:hypothetical protein [Thermodesulfobacteriota bacterium]